MISTIDSTCMWCRGKFAALSSVWKKLKMRISIQCSYTPRELPYVKGTGMLVGKFEFEPLKETNLGVARALKLCLTPKRYHSKRLGRVNLQSMNGNDSVNGWLCRNFKDFMSDRCRPCARNNVQLTPERLEEGLSRKYMNKIPDGLGFSRHM